MSSSPDREKLIEAAAIEAADFLPAYPDGGRTARACAERVLAGAGFFDLFDRLAEPERERVIRHVCGDDCSEPKQEGVPTVPMLRDGNGWVDPYVKLRQRDAELEELCDEIERLRAAAGAVVAAQAALDGDQHSRTQRLNRAISALRAALAADREPEPVTDDRLLSRAPEGGRPDYVQRMRDLAESVGERNERIRALREEWPVRITDMPWPSLPRRERPSE